MLVSTGELLADARAKVYAIGAFNVYNLEGVGAVVGAAEAARSPAILQLHPAALDAGGATLIAACLAAAQHAAVPVGVHLDHSTSRPAIENALASGVVSIMADGSEMPYEKNIAFTRAIADMVHARGGTVEAELGRLGGTEDGLTVEEYEAHLTDPAQAADFVARAGVDALAVCIGNVHGRYHGEPRLDFERLEAIRRAADVPLVLHGASGLPDTMVREAIALGVCKFNVNTELREAYLATLREQLASQRPPELLPLMRDAVAAMQAVVDAKLRLFGSAGRA